MWVWTVISRRWIRSGWVGRATRIATSASRMLRSTSLSPMISEMRISGWRSTKSASCADQPDRAEADRGVDRADGPAGVVAAVAERGLRPRPCAWRPRRPSASRISPCSVSTRPRAWRWNSGVPQILLERADLAADRRLAQAQPLGGAGEAAGLGHGMEDPHPVPVHHRASFFVPRASRHAAAQPIPARNFSASSAAMQPLPAAVTAWR